MKYNNFEFKNAMNDSSAEESRPPPGPNSSTSPVEMSSSSDSRSQSYYRSSVPEQPAPSDTSDLLQTHRFLGCYLLVSKSTGPRSKNRTYVGFTVNPPRRIKQHNGELKYGGAKRTKRHRPWRMIAVIHGFANKTQGLQFEWAWQNPFKSIALKTHVNRPEALNLPGVRRTSVNGRLQTLSAMVSIPPWSLCPLTLTIMAPREEWDHFQIQNVIFPKYFRVNFSPLSSFSQCTLSYNYRHPSDAVGPKRLHGRSTLCSVCSEPVTTPDAANGETIRKATHCSHCGVLSHLACIASCRDPDDFVPSEALLPNMIRCKSCNSQMHWSLVVRLARALATDED